MAGLRSASKPPVGASQSAGGVSRSCPSRAMTSRATKLASRVARFSLSCPGCPQLTQEEPMSLCSGPQSPGTGQLGKGRKRLPWAKPRCVAPQCAPGFTVLMQTRCAGQFRLPLSVTTALAGPCSTCVPIVQGWAPATAAGSPQTLTTAVQPGKGGPTGGGHLHVCTCCWSSYHGPPLPGGHSSHCHGHSPPGLSGPRGLHTALSAPAAQGLGDHIVPITPTDNLSYRAETTPGQGHGRLGSH